MFAEVADAPSFAVVDAIAAAVKGGARTRIHRVVHEEGGGRGAPKRGVPAAGDEHAKGPASKRSRDEEPTAAPKKGNFAACAAFAGRREGCVFKMDTQGLGYYRDGGSHS